MTTIPDPAAGKRELIEVSADPVGPSDYDPPINEDAVADCTSVLVAMDEITFLRWVAALTWEHTATAGHWDRMEAAAREFDRRHLHDMNRN